MDATIAPPDAGGASPDTAAGVLREAVRSAARPQATQPPRTKSRIAVQNLWWRFIGSVVRTLVYVIVSRCPVKFWPVANKLACFNRRVMCAQTHAIICVQIARRMPILPRVAKFLTPFRPSAGPAPVAGVLRRF